MTVAPPSSGRLASCLRAWVLIRLDKFSKNAGHVVKGGGGEDGAGDESGASISPISKGFT